MRLALQHRWRRFLFVGDQEPFQLYVGGYRYRKTGMFTARRAGYPDRIVFPWRKVRTEHLVQEDEFGTSTNFVE